MYPSVCKASELSHIITVTERSRRMGYKRGMGSTAGETGEKRKGYCPSPVG